MTLDLFELTGRFIIFNISDVVGIQLRIHKPIKEVGGDVVTWFRPTNTVDEYKSKLSVSNILSPRCI